MNITQEHQFGADIFNLLKIVKEHIYEKPEVFLRELVSNASDACEKMYIEASKNHDKLSHVINRSDLKIEIIIDKDNKKLIIADNGIGMSAQDLIDNLGTIACSGTKKFFQEKLDGKNADGGLIGQFGIGFYSAFLIADNVEVKTKKFDSNEMLKWSSDGVSGFKIEEMPGQASDNFSSFLKDNLYSGTEITLYVRDSEDQYLNKHRIKYLIELYSKNISFDILLKDLSVENKDQTQDEVLNQEKALWTKNKNEITKEEYEKFFQQVGGVYGAPWSIIHSKVEGESNYTYLLFIPELKPFAMFDPDRKTSLKLHVNKIFVSEDAPIIPKYLRFVKGIVDSYDLPLNVSRETVQQNFLIQRMNNYLTKKILAELKYLSTDETKKLEYETIFWPNFGAVLKEGLCEPLNTDARENILDLCLFENSKNSEKLISLAEYIQQMPETQQEIFYFTGASVEEMLRNPQLEGFLARDINVLLMVDGVDDFWLNVVSEYKDKKFKSISQADIDLELIKNLPSESCQTKDNEENKDEAYVEEINNLTKYFKEVLGDSVKDVIISKKLSSSPACLAVQEGQMNMKMERFLIDQKQLQSKTAKIFEINKNHSLIKKISENFKENGDNEELKEKILNLFDFVCIIEGEDLANSKSFSERAAKILNNLL